MARLLGDIDIDRLPFQKIHLRGDSIELEESLCPCNQGENPPFLRIVDTNFADDPKRLTFDRAELVIDSHGIQAVPVTIDLASYNAKYTLSEMDKLIRFAGAYFSSPEKQKDCRAISDGKKPPRFCAVTDFFDPKTGGYYDFEKEGTEPSTNRKPSTIPLVVSYTDNGKKGERDAEDLIRINVGTITDQTMIFIHGDSPYAALFQNPFASPPPPSPSPASPAATQGGPTPLP
ncbi:MAG: hypothetical protein HYS22_03515 [Deltaproteobacteria bacterium]|nr:hypothetical protein [Deltaproteobacteria bacterium]